jgi:sugar phosphate isomerase/epimerase
MYRNLSPGAVGIGGDHVEICKLAAKVGFQGIDFDPGFARKLAEEKSVQAVKDFYAELGLRPAGFGLPVEFRRDEQAFEDSLKGLPAMAEIAGQVGCDRCPTWILPASDELPFAENFEQHRRRLGECAKILQDHGVWLGLEFVGPKTSRHNSKYEFIWNMKGMLELADAIGTGNVGLLLDCWHWYTSYGTVEELRTARGEQIVYVHVNDAPEGVPVDEQIDNVRRMPGATGVIDIAAFLGALDEIGADAPITAEPFFPEINALPNDEAAQATLDSLDRIFALAGVE